MEQGTTKMRFLRLSVFILLMLLVGQRFVAKPAVAQNPAPEATPAALDCMRAPESTPEATEVIDATPEATPEGIQAADAPLRFDSFTSTDVNFNPDKQSPVVVIMVFSLVFQ